MFIVFSKDECPYCDEAIEFIQNELRSTVKTFDVEDHPATHRSIMEETGHKTVPAIYVGPNFIGGCDDLMSLHESKGLRILMLEEENRLLKLQIDRLRRSF